MMTAPLITSHPTPDDRSTNPFRTTITTFDDRSTDREPSTAHPTLDDCSTYRPMDTITAPLPFNKQHTLIKINFIINNNNYLIIQPKNRLHTPSRAITSLLTTGALSLLTAGALSFLAARAPSLLTAGAPSKPFHSRSTIQAFSQ